MVKTTTTKKTHARQNVACASTAASHSLPLLRVAGSDESDEKNSCNKVLKYIIVTYFRGSIILRKWNGHISRDLNFAIWPKNT